jgi:hypothetical protein
MPSVGDVESAARGWTRGRTEEKAVDMYVAVLSSHGTPTEVKLFSTEADARKFARDLSQREGYEDKSGHTFEHEGHAHHYNWLEHWGDEDGCGIVVGTSASP